MASLFTPPFLDVGAGLQTADGALLNFFVVGSGTRKNTFTTAAATVVNANPVVADALGVFPAIFLSGDYDWTLQDKNAVQRNSGSVSEFLTTTAFAADISLAYEKPFATLAAAVADTGLIDGDVLTTGDRGGATWDVVLSSTVTENAYDIVQCTGVATLSLQIRLGSEINVVKLGAGAATAAATNDAILARAVVLAEANSLPINLASIQATTAAFWHVNEKVDVYGNGATLTGGDSDGVMGFGYRTGANQNVYFINRIVRDITLVATTAGGDGFKSFKSINCTFKNIIGDGCAGDGVRFEAAVACQIENVRARLNGYNGVIFTYFTNSDGTTHVPTTACTMVNLTSDGNGTDGGADATNSFGVLCDKTPDGRRAAYGNQFFGGYVQENQFTGVRDFGDNEWTIWIERNGINAGSTQQYNFWDSGPEGSIIKAGRNQGAGVLRKIYVDGAVNRPTTKNVTFDGALQTDIQYEVTIAGTHTGSSGAAVLTDTTKAWAVNALAGKVITNSTDGSTATIVSNTEQTITGTLSGGTDDDWDAADVYSIADAPPTNIIQDNNYYSGSSPEITPSAYDQRSAIIGTVRQNTFIATLTDVMFELEIAANSTGSAIYTSIGQLTDNTQTAVFSITVHIDGAPPTLFGQIVQKSAEVTGSNQYVRFTTAYNERYSVTATDSGTADLPIIRITAAGDVQYKQNDGSSAQKIQGTFTKKA
jgi:hypothetical protein